MADDAATGTSDPLYNLILLTQQALEDCLRYQHFARDAREAGDVELADYFDELAQNDREVAARAKSLLRARLGDDADSRSG
jgi:rubrerythrin